MKYLVSILISLSILNLQKLHAQAEEVKTMPAELHGYIKNMQTTTFIDRPDSNSSVSEIHNRLNFKFNLSRNLSGRLEIRNRILYGDQLKQIPQIGEIIDEYSSLLDLSNLWIDEPSFVFHSVIDRMLLQYNSEKWDMKLGRQRINWGINNIWNPNDIFNAYNFLDFDYEERAGMDAIRIKHIMENNRAVEIAYKPMQNKNEHIAALLYSFNTRKYDLQFLSGIYQSDLVAGCGWAGNIKDAGFKGEMSYFHPQKKITDTSGTFSLSLTADRTFTNNWYVSVAGLYNSDPTNVFTGGGNIYSSDLSAKLLFPFRYNYYAGFIKSFSPITSLSISCIYSPKMNFLIIFPSFAWNIDENFDLDITAQSYFAEQFNKYQNLGLSVFIRVKWSF